MNKHKGSLSKERGNAVNSGKVVSGSCSKNSSINRSIKNKGSNVQTPTTCSNSNNNNNIRTNKIIFSLHNCNFSNVLKKNFNSKEPALTKPKRSPYINPSTNFLPNNNIHPLNIKKQLLHPSKRLTTSLPKKQRAQTTSTSLTKPSNIRCVKKRFPSQVAAKPLYKPISYY